MEIASVQELIDAGVHFGCRVARRNPRMEPYIYGRRNMIHIIDLRETLKGILRAQNLLYHMAAEGSSILWVGTKRQIKGVILEHDEIKKISVEGHTDSDGNDRYNQDLSERRAASVVKYLVEHGVAEERLAAVGYGESKPLVEETSDADKETNRRVEFHITEQDKREIEYEVDPKTGEKREVKADK